MLDMNGFKLFDVYKLSNNDETLSHRFVLFGKRCLDALSAFDDMYVFTTVVKA